LRVTFFDKLRANGLGELSQSNYVIRLHRAMNNPPLRRFDAAELLCDKGDVASYLAVALEEGDADLILSALSDVASARGGTRSRSARH
jgi:hypothetical protein